MKSIYSDFMLLKTKDKGSINYFLKSARFENRNFTAMKNKFCKFE